MVRFSALVCVLFLRVLNGFGQERPETEASALTADLKLLVAYVEANLVYPEDARKAGLEVVVFVRFSVNSGGYIVKDSVKATKGISLSCDQEAVRLVRAYPGRWKVETRERMVIPVTFSLKDGQDVQVPQNILGSPIPAVVREKRGAGAKQAWTVYADRSMTTKVCNLTPGTKVIVEGWEPWSCYIRAGETLGYISYLALQGDEPLYSLLHKIAWLSGVEDLAEQGNDVTPVTEEILRSKDAYLQLHAPNEEIYEGACTTLSLNVVIKEPNTLKLDFHDLPGQIQPLGDILTRPSVVSWRNNSLTEAIAVRKVDAQGSWLSYKLFECVYCPQRAGTLAYPAVPLKMMLGEKTLPDTQKKVVAIESTPVAIQVKALPPTAVVSEFHGMRMVGSYGMEEKVSKDTAFVRDEILYTLDIWGNGLTSAIDAPRLPFPDAISELISVVTSDTILRGTLLSRKKFQYRIRFQKPGTYGFDSTIVFNYFNPVAGINKTLIPAQRFTVLDTERYPGLKPDYSAHHFIAIDASKSMTIEDYETDRFSVAKTGVTAFLVNESAKHIGLITFAGDIRYIPFTPGGRRYTASKLEHHITLRGHRDGTAIGDAVRFAQAALPDTATPKKLVIIGDGYHSAGFMNPAAAAHLARANNIKIYTIGIGYKGTVPYGKKPATGEPFMVAESFTDIVYKEISQITGGTYYWAMTEQQVTEILKHIFIE